MALDANTDPNGVCATYTGGCSIGAARSGGAAMSAFAVGLALLGLRTRRRSTRASR